MQRTALGIIALIFLIGGAAGEFMADNVSQTHSAADVALRTGMLLGVIWLALPDLQKLPWWLFLAVLGGAVAAWYLVGRFKYLLPLVLVAGVLFLFFRPRKRSTKSQSSPDR